MRTITHDALVLRLRRAGGVFAEEEAAVLAAAARDGQELERWCVRREAGELLEQVVGRVELCGEHLAVGPGCFVPRQRTALLIGAALVELRGRARPVLVEAFCGVAPVAAVVGRRMPAARLHVTDQDRRPLVHARTNLPPTAGVHHGSVLDGLPPELAGAVDLLVAVPPYVPRTAWELMPRDARENEPLSALVAGEDGLDEVRRLLMDAPRWLAPSAVLLIEMHRCQAPAALAAAQERDAYGEVGIVAGEDGETVLLRAESARTVSSGPAADLVLLRRVRDRIDRDFAEPLDVEELARGVHVSAGHLSRRFREEYGESPYSYLMTRRIERAMTMLRRTTRSVTEVCMEVGFSSPGTFSTRFKELVGVPPSVYRERGAEITDRMPPCIARKVTRPIRNREARRREEA